MLGPNEVAHALTSTPIFTVCNSSNAFVLVSDPATGLRYIGLLCFRSKDADALLFIRGRRNHDGWRACA